jgi:hypothetical protein
LKVFRVENFRKDPPFAKTAGVGIRGFCFRLV